MLKVGALWCILWLTVVLYVCVLMLRPGCSMMRLLVCNILLVWSVCWVQIVCWKSAIRLSVTLFGAGVPRFDLSTVLTWCRLLSRSWILLSASETVRLWKLWFLCVLAKRNLRICVFCVVVRCSVNLLCARLEQLIGSFAVRCSALTVCRPILALLAGHTDAYRSRVS